MVSSRVFLCSCLLAASASAAITPALALAPATATRRPHAALILPPDSIGEIVLVEGGVNFLQLYQGLLSLRILLSWFPQAQGVAVLRPIFTASDVYLNLFRGVVPPIGGIDISPIGAFFVLNLLTSSVASLGATGAPIKRVQQPLPGSRLLQQLRERVAH